MEERVFKTSEVQLNYARGVRGGPSVVLLHGVTRRWQDWVPVLPPLTVRWRVHALDLRGHGHSGWVPGAYNVLDYARDVVAFLDTAVEGKAVLIGHSLGALVAAAVAAQRPGLVKGLVLEDPAFGLEGDRLRETAFHGLFRAGRALAGSNRPVDEMAAVLAEAPVRVPGRSEEVPLGTLRDPVSLRFSAACLRQLDPGVLDAVLEDRWMAGYDADALLAQITCPTLLLAADPELGGALTPAQVEGASALLTRCITIPMPGVGHQIHTTQPEAASRLILGFVESLD